MAAGHKVLEYIIGAKDATGSAIKSALARVKDFASKIGSNLMNIQAGFSMLGTAARKAMEFMRKAFAFETMTVQFKTLIGNMDEARAHMKMLQELGETPPFSLEEFAKASRTMMVMTDNALGFKKSLEMVGDAAAATGQPVETLAHEVGRAYAIIRDGQPLTRATMALRNMGVLTPEVAKKLEDLQSAGASNVEVWREFEAALNKHTGAMAETEQTGEGLIGAISAQWDGTVREFGEAFLECSKDGLGALLEKMKEIREDGTLITWANGIAEAIGEICEKFKEFHEWLNKTGDAAAVDKFDRSRNGNGDPNQDWSERDGFWMQLVNTPTLLNSWGAGLENGLFGDSHDGFADRFKSASLAYFAENGHGAQADEAARRFAAMNQSDVDIRDVRDQEIAHDKAEAAKQIAEKKAEAERINQKKAEEEDKRIAEQMAEAQKKQDAKRAEELKKAEEAAAKKRAEEEARIREKEEAERQRMEEKLSRERIRLMQNELNEREKMEADAANGLAEAQEKVRQAWGWYRDKDSLKAQLAEEKAEGAAQKQFEKDFAKLRDRRRDWRTADNLSLDEEAVRRVGLAREAEAEAQKRLDEIAENTRELADRLEELLTMEE